MEGDAEAWISKYLKSPKNLATELELREQARIAINYFKEADTDGRGTLSFQELKRLCDQMGLPMENDEEEMLMKMDTDDSGALDIDEWGIWWLGRVSSLPNPAKQQEAIARNTFAKFDTDSSGFLDAAELRKLIIALGADFTDEEIEQAVAEIDSDQSGVIEPQEFIMWWTNRSLSSHNNTSLISLKLKRLAAKAAQVFNTDIFTACWNGDEALVRSFLGSEKRLAQASDESDYGEQWTPLQYACYRGHTQIVHMLLDAGAVVNATNKLGFTALFYAAQQGRVDLCTLLVERGADPTITGTHPDKLSLYLSPVDHCVDCKELRTIFRNHSKCTPPEVISSDKIDCSISGSNNAINLTIRMQQKTISALALQAYKISISVDPLESSAALDEELPSTEILLIAPHPNQTQSTQGTLDTKFMKFLRYFCNANRLNALELGGNMKRDITRLWEETKRLYLAIEPTYRGKINLEETFVAALDRGVDDATAIVMRKLFKTMLASGRVGEEAHTTAGYALERLNEVVAGFTGTENMASTSSLPSAAAGMKPSSSAASGVSTTAKGSSGSHGIISMDKSDSKRTLPSKAPSKSASAASVAMSKADGKDDASSSQRTGQGQGNNNEGNIQKVLIKVAPVNALYVGSYSEEIEVMIKM